MQYIYAIAELSCMDNLFNLISNKHNMYTETGLCFLVGARAETRRFSFQRKGRLKTTVVYHTEPMKID